MPALPGFGTPKQLPEFYKHVSQIISILKPYSTLRTISIHLNNQGFQTPMGKPWCRQAVANFIRSSSYNKTN